ncbi:MAG: hypothetical protein RLY66_573 [Candidatus Parcubacteria bacterium]
MKRNIICGVSFAVVLCALMSPLRVLAAVNPPTLVDYQQSDWTDKITGNEVTPTVTWQAGDLVVVLGATENNDTSAAYLNTPTATGLAFSLVTSVNTTPVPGGDGTPVYAWSAVAGSNGSGVVTSTSDGFAFQSRGISVFVYRGSGGIGATNILDNSTSKDISLTRGSDNSAVAVVMSDWNAVNDTTVTASPSSGGTQRVAQFVSGSNTSFVFSWTDQGTAGTTNYGITDHTGTVDMSGIVVEVKGISTITVGNTSDAGNWTGATSRTWSHVHASGSDGAIVLLCSTYGNPGAMTATFNGVSMTEIGQARIASQEGVVAFILSNPAAATANIVFNVPGGGDGTCGAISAYGVSSTIDASNITTIPSAVYPMTVSASASTAGNLVLSTFQSVIYPNISVPGSQTEFGLGCGADGSNYCLNSYSLPLSSGTQTHTYNNGVTTADTGAIAIVILKAAVQTSTDLSVSPHASSTSFFIKHRTFSGTGGSSASAFGTSTSFKLLSAVGQAAIGTSTSASFGIQSGFLRNLYKGPAPSYTQIHYHWRNDDGSETTATSKTSSVSDTNITGLAELTGVRLRVEVSNEGGTILNYSTQQFRLEYGLKSPTCAAIVSWTDVGAVGGDWDMYDSSNLTDGGNTTNIAVSSGGVANENATFISSNGGIKDTSSTAAAVSVSSDAYTELEYSIQALVAASDGGTYCFRVTNAGSATNYTYTAYPEAAIAGGSLTFTVDGATQALGTITPGVLAATSSILTVASGNSTGFNITINRDNGTGTMSSGSNYIPDKTAWVPGVATTSAGNATASTTEAQTLQFRVRSAGTDAPNYASAWWGTADTTASALFAGIPSTARQIVNRSTPSLTDTVVRVLYNVTTPVTQVNGSYSGGITYTATANP